MLGDPAVGFLGLEEAPRHRVDLGQALGRDLADVGLVCPLDLLLELSGGRLEVEQWPAHRGQRDPGLDVVLARSGIRLGVRDVVSVGGHVEVGMVCVDDVAVPQVRRRRFVLRVGWRGVLDGGHRVGERPDPPRQGLGQIRVGHLDVAGVQQSLEGPPHLQSAVDDGDQVRPHRAGLDRAGRLRADEVGQAVLPRGAQGVVAGHGFGGRGGEVGVDAPPQRRSGVVVGQRPFVQGAAQRGGGVDSGAGDRGQTRGEHR
ncbi:hypothetical protein [Micromonospora fulviviridis]|uniref:Uncharacterized protein n=1 Tax=Micromonospora fulviviridis TaxID=47860 RepID=A0ABV2VWU8_9ACTN